MGHMVQVMETMQANPHEAQPPQPQGYLGFMITNPPIFTRGKDPMVVDHWLRAIEQKFTLLQCTEDEKVNFVVHQLQEVASHWWHDYHARLQPNA